MKLYIILLFSITCCNAGHDHKRIYSSYRQVVLTQMSLISYHYELHKVWPASNINKENSGLSERTCNVFYNPNRWVLRWFYPHRRGGHSPRSCMPYVEGYVNFYLNENIKQLLQTHWPNIISNVSDIVHWEHKWHKYGSCLRDIHSMSKVKAYFEKALELLNIYNIGSSLERHEIHPGGSYSVNRIFDIIKNEYRIEPRMKCITVENSQQQQVQYLWEISMCFNKQLLLEDCLDNGYRSCNNETALIYPNLEVIHTNLSI